MLIAQKIYYLVKYVFLAMVLTFAASQYVVSQADTWVSTQEMSVSSFS